MNCNQGKSLISHANKYIKRRLGAYFPTVGLHAQCQVYIELTTRCNMKCSYCYLWEQDHSGEVPAEVWKEMMPELLKTLGSVKVNLAGGEPLVSPALFDLLEICNQYGAFSGFVTNGRLLNEKNIQRLAQLNIANINISLDDDRPEVFDSIRNAPGHTELLLKNIAALQEALQKNHCKTLVYLKSVISAQNIDRLVHMVEFAKANRCMISFQPISAPFGKPEKSDWYKDNPLWPSEAQRETLHKVINELQRMQQQHAPIGNSPHELVQWHDYFDNPEAFEKNFDDKPCLVGYNNLYIFSDGNVKFCPTRPIVGNIKNQNIREILLSPKAEKEVISMRKCKGKSCVKTCMMPKSLGEMLSIFLKLNKRH